MKLRFSKMHGLGNDFIVLDGVRQDIVLDRDQIRFLANRQLGVGFDQLLLLEPSELAGCDFKYRIFNADGGEVQACGNGARCAGRFLVQQGLTNSDKMALETAAGAIGLELLGDRNVRVNMGSPQFLAPQIPTVARVSDQQIRLAVGGFDLSLYVLSMGNPHALLMVDNLDEAPVAQIGQAVANHGAFPESVNVGFCQVLGRSRIALRVYERGVGETKACGTGACAAVVACILADSTDTVVTVQLPGGQLLIEWRGKGQPVFMTGDAAMVYQGEIDI